MKKELIALLLFLAVTSLTTQARQLPMTLRYSQPATFFEESLPIGNGRMGALVYGHPDCDMLQLNDITLWTGCPVDTNEDEGAWKWIPEIRKALFAEDYALADSLQLHVQGHNSCFYQPLGTLRITDLKAPTAGTTPLSWTEGSYRRCLSLDSAIARVTYQREGVSFCREYIASAPDSMVAVHLTASRPAQISIELTMNSLLPHTSKASGHQLTMMGHADGDADHTIHFCTIVRVDSKGGHTAATDTSLVVSAADEVTLWVVNATSFNGFDRHPVTQGAPYIELANNRAWHTVNVNFEQVRRRHVADHRHFFSRVELLLDQAGDTQAQPCMPAPDVTTDQLLKTYNTGNSHNDRYLETLYFQYGRYLLIGCSRTPAVPANLQGLWNPHQWAPWRCNYTVNINLEENYWPAFVANLPEMAMPLDGFLKALAGNGQHTARNYYGVKQGWCSSHNSDIWAMTNPVGEKNEKPEWANWNMGGAWLVQTLWERYLFTQDTLYLRQVAYPLMKGAAEFCSSWLVDNPNNPGELVTAPSTSPENEYVTPQGYHGMTCYGGTADMSIISELFTNVGNAISILKLNDKATTQFNALINKQMSRLRPYTVGSHGDLNEWYYDWADNDSLHRHQSHLIGLFPGHHIDTDHKLAPAFEQTLIQKGDHTTGWSTGWRINLWARLHNGTQAYDLLQKLLSYVSPDAYRGSDRQRPGGGTYPNLFDAHPPFQIDGNFGGTAGICEMLLQSTAHTTGAGIDLELLPALPAQWSNGQVKGLCARGNMEVDIVWQQGQVTQATLHPTHDGTVRVKANGMTRSHHVEANTPITLRYDN